VVVSQHSRIDNEDESENEGKPGNPEPIARGNQNALAMGTGRMSRGRWHYSDRSRIDSSPRRRTIDFPTSNPSLVSRLETAIVLVLVVVLVLGF